MAGIRSVGLFGVAWLIAGCAATGATGSRDPAAAPGAPSAAASAATSAASGTAAAPSAAPILSAAPASGPVIAVIREPAGTGPLYLDAGAGRIWVDDHSSFDASIIDPTTNSVTPLDVPTQGGVEFLDGQLWASSYDAGVMTRLDPATLKVTGTVHVPHAGGLVQVDKQVYVYHDGSLTALDIDTLKTGETFDIGGSCWGLAIAEGAVWCGGGPDGEVVWRFDLKTRRITDHWDVGHYGVMLLLDGTIWGTGRASPDLLQIDVKTKQLRTLPLGGTPGGLYDAFGSVWLTDYETGTIRRLDRKTAALGPAVDLGFPGLGPPFAAFGSVWVSSIEGDVVLRIDPDRVPMP